MTHICIGKQTIIVSDNGLSPGWHQAIIWTNAGILLIGPLWTNFNEILVQMEAFLLKRILLKMLSVICCSFCLGLSVLMGLHCIMFHWMSMQCKCIVVLFSTFPLGKAPLLFIPTYHYCNWPNVLLLFFTLFVIYTPYIMTVMPIHCMQIAACLGKALGIHDCLYSKNMWLISVFLKTFRLKQNGCHIVNNICRFIFLNQ